VSGIESKPLIPLASRSELSGIRPAEPFTVATPTPVSVNSEKPGWTNSSVSVPS
jgi:hypothetical protein